jgi:uncharacterized protein YcfJ
MNKHLTRAVLALVTAAAAGSAMAGATFYAREGLQGDSVRVDQPIWNFNRINFNDRASSVVIDRGPWEICEHARFEGRCVVLRHGTYPSLRAIGFDNQISSARPLDEHRRHEWESRVWTPPPAAPVYGAAAPVYSAPQPVYTPPPPQPAFYDVPVSSVHAVVGPPQQRCWVERNQVQAAPSQPNTAGAVIGGIVGGVLGHQVGKGSGRDLATIGGAVAGAAVGSQVNSGGGGVVQQDVQRCTTVSDTKPAYWDVSYFFGGVEHRVQLANPPGNVIRVNQRGEPVL